MLELLLSYNGSVLVPQQGQVIIQMESVVRHSAKGVEEYRHNIKLLKYHLKKQQKTNETLKFKDYKKKKQSHVHKQSTIEAPPAAYSMLHTVNQLNHKTKEMGLVLGDVFRMADYGYDGQISKQQFMRVILRLKANLEESLINEMFYAIDTDLNNNLSQDQYEEFLWAHGGCNNQDASRFQKRSAQKFAALLKKKHVKLSDFLNRMVDPVPSQNLKQKLTQTGLNSNEAMILLKMWDPSLKGQIRHQVYLKAMENVKVKNEEDIQNQKFEKGVQELCVIFRDRKLNPIVIFEEAEADGKPGISEFQLQEGLRKLLPEETGYQIRKWVNLLNLNGDNEITREQFVSAIRSFYSIQQIDKYSTEYDKLHPELKRAISNDEIPAEKIINQLSIAIEDSGLTKAETFNRIDINHNGLMDKQELHDGLKSMGINIGLIAKVLTVFDRDASGQITLTEWLNILGQDVEMEEVDIPPPKKKEKKTTIKPPKNESQESPVKASATNNGSKQESVNRTTKSKKTEPPKTQNNDKTVKAQNSDKTVKVSQKRPVEPTQKKAVKKNTVVRQPVRDTPFAEDLQEPNYKEPEQEEVSTGPVEQELAQLYANDKKGVLEAFRTIVKTKRGISQKDLQRSLGQLRMRTASDPTTIQTIFESNVASNGTLLYQQWLQDLATQHGYEIKPEKEEPAQQQAENEQPVKAKKQYVKEPASKPKIDIPAEEPKKRGEDHEMFQGLQKLVIKDQQHIQKGYKFSEYISTSSQLQLLNQRYLPFAEKLKSKGKPHQDASFPGKLSSFTTFSPPSKSNIPDVSLLKWKSYHQMFREPQLFNKGIEPNDIRQGELGDCYFLCSLASMAEYTNLIERLFQYIDLENEYFLIWLCIDGIWRLIQLDGLVPVKPDGRSFVFSRCREGDQELWVVLLEKAYAKAYGCYQHIIGGQPYEAIKDLTGAPGKSFSHRSKDINPDVLWSVLEKANRQKFMMTCGTDEAEKGDMKLDDHSQSVTQEGIVIGHAYSILDVAMYKQERLVQLRNPWGTVEWSGPWADSSREWTSEAKVALKYQGGGDDGIFWMPFDTYYQKYATTAVNYIRPNYYYHSETKKNITNLVVRFKANAFRHGFIMAAQEDHRKKGLPGNTPYHFTHLIGLNCQKGKVLHKLADEKYMYQREGSIEIDSKGVDPSSQFVVLINLEKGTDINLCSYSDQQFEYECDDSFDLMLQYIEAVAMMEDGAKNVQTSNGFKSWLTSVGEYAFLVFKNVSNRPITLDLQLSEPKNMAVRSRMKNTVKLAVGEGDTIQGKILDQKKPFSFGPMRFSMR